MTQTLWIYKDSFGQLRHYDYGLTTFPVSWEFLGTIEVDY